MHRSGSRFWPLGSLAVLAVWTSVARGGEIHPFSEIRDPATAASANSGTFADLPTPSSQDGLMTADPLGGPNQMSPRSDAAIAEARIRIEANTMTRPGIRLTSQFTYSHEKLISLVTPSTCTVSGYTLPFRGLEDVSFGAEGFVVKGPSGPSRHDPVIIMHKVPEPPSVVVLAVVASGLVVIVKRRGCQRPDETPDSRR